MLLLWFVWRLFSEIKLLPPLLLLIFCLPYTKQPPNPTVFLALFHRRPLFVMADEDDSETGFLCVCVNPRYSLGWLPNRELISFCSWSRKLRSVRTWPGSLQECQCSWSCAVSYPAMTLRTGRWWCPCAPCRRGSRRCGYRTEQSDKRRLLRDL